MNKNYFLNNLVLKYQEQFRGNTIFGNAAYKIRMVGMRPTIILLVGLLLRQKTKNGRVSYFSNHDFLSFYKWFAGFDLIHTVKDQLVQ